MYSLIEVWIVHCHWVSKWAVPITCRALVLGLAPSWALTGPIVAVRPISEIIKVLTELVILGDLVGCVNKIRKK